MRSVLFIIESFALGGAERALVDIVNHLDPVKFDITILSLFKHSVNSAYPFEIPRSELREGIRSKYLVNNHNRLIYKIFNYLLNHCPASVFRWLVGDKYDVVVGFYEGAPTRFASKARLRRGRKIAWLHTSMALSQKNKAESLILAEEDRYKAFDRIVAVSEKVAESFVSMFPSMNDKIVVAYPPIVMSEVSRKSRDTTRLRKPASTLLVSVGRITWAKGYDRYLRVVKNLKSKGFRPDVWILGGGDRESLEKFCDESGLDNVHFFGNVENPYPYMKLADWMVLPSYVEGFCLVSMEALALGKAIIATRCPGTEELLGKSEYGLVVDNSEDALEAGLERVLTEKNLTTKYESTAMARASLFDVDACMKRIEEMLIF